jgi:protein-S-isoprenylcysteine O-methyltransferase Ste14
MGVNMNKIKLLFSAIIKFSFGIIFVGLLLFLPAGTFDFFNAWLFMGLLFIPIFILGIFLFVKSPELLEKRLNAKEKENTQKGVVGFSAILFLASFLIAGFDFHFGWTQVPIWCVILASVILLVSYALYAEVMRENIYLSRTIEVQENQKVIDTGLYGIIRHPMYAVTIWLFLSIPVVLGSWWALLCMAPYPFLIAIRILNEEKLLENNLSGYKEYKAKVKYRLVPFIW